MIGVHPGDTFFKCEVSTFKSTLLVPLKPKVREEPAIEALMESSLQTQLYEESPPSKIGSVTGTSAAETTDAAQNRLNTNDKKIFVIFMIPGFLPPAFPKSAMGEYRGQQELFVKHFAPS